LSEPTRNRRGKESDNLLLQAIIMYPGLSEYELAKRLEWRSGKTDGSIRRLLNQGLITINHTERGGRIVNLIYPKQTLYPRETKPPNTIEIPAKLLQPDSGGWGKGAFIYALDSNTIGIAGAEKPEWKESAAFTGEILLRREKDKMVFEIPEKFSRFYGIGRKHTAASVNGNAVLITISGNTIEEKIGMV
jgi:hypothetical protein